MILHDCERTKKDRKLKNLQNKSKNKNLHQLFFNNITIWTMVNPKTDEHFIYVPPTLREQLLDWYHQNLKHPRVNRMSLTIRKHFGYPGIQKDIHEIVKTYDACLKNRMTASKSWHVPDLGGTSCDIPEFKLV